MLKPEVDRKMPKEMMLFLDMPSFRDIIFSLY